MKHVTAQWDAAILICRKCSKKAKGGFGEKGKTSLAKLLRARGNGKRGRKADMGIFETSCLKVCPKHGVVAINAARPRDWLIVPTGMAEGAVAAALGLEDGSGSSGID